MKLDLLEGEALVGVLDQQLHAEILRGVRRVADEPSIVHRAHLVGLVVRIAEGFRELSNILLLRYASTSLLPNNPLSCSAVIPTMSS